jgi:hypothetical protein
MPLKVSDGSGYHLNKCLDSTVRISECLYCDFVFSKCDFWIESYFTVRHAYPNEALNFRVAFLIVLDVQLLE